jgi:secondary thiamine-phosphate synthase enzyme
MKVYKKELTINTQERIQFVNITHKVQEAINESGIKEGLVLVNPMHITASVFINDNESGLIRDFKIWLEKLAPQKFDYNHHQTGEDNGFAHLWRTIMGRESVVAISNGKLDFGPWEEIFYGEFDGQRNKRIMIKIIGE